MTTKTRLSFALGCLIALGLPAGAEARVLAGPGHHLRLDLQASVELPLESTRDRRIPRLVLEGGYLLRFLRLGARARLELAGSLGYQALAVATVFLRVPLVYLYGGLGLGFYSRELDDGSIDRGGTANLDLGLRLAFSRWIAPFATFTYAPAYGGAGWSHELSGRAGVAVTF